MKAGDWKMTVEVLEEGPARFHYRIYFSHLPHGQESVTGKTQWWQPLEIPTDEAKRRMAAIHRREFRFNRIDRTVADLPSGTALVREFRSLGPGMWEIVIMEGE